MYLSLLSALLLGLFPTVDTESFDVSTLESIQIAPSSEAIEISEHLSASGVVIYDALSGQRLYAKQARTQRPMASLTKLMTALLIVENHELDEMVLVPKSVVDVAGNKVYLEPGKHYSVGDLLSALLINSANDAATTLAQFHSGSVSAFVGEMNDRALQLGMTGTSFHNPAGLDHPAHWSTPQDIAVLTMFSLRYEEIASRLSSTGERIASVEGDNISLYHTHALMHEVSPVLAGKTGTTTDAGQCLMSLVEGVDQQYIVVLFNSNQRYKDMRIILSSLKTEPEPVASQ